MHCAGSNGPNRMNSMRRFMMSFADGNNPARLAGSPRRKPVWHTAIVYLLVGLTLTGCCHVPGARCRDWWRNGMKVGPNYCPPPAPVASEWIDYADPRVKSEEAKLANWWSVFNDSTLNMLIET